MRRRRSYRETGECDLQLFTTIQSKVDLEVWEVNW